MTAIHITCFNTGDYSFCPQNVFILCILEKPVGLSNGDVVRFPRGKNWIFKYFLDKLQDLNG
jgi:hypothetical protein